MTSKSPTGKYTQVLKSFVPTTKNQGLTQKNKLNIVRGIENEQKKSRRKPPS